jgi:hypothetical protein
MAAKGEELMARNGQAPAEDAPESPEEPLLAGKFRSPEDLEKAYIELQRKLGSGEGGEATEAAVEAIGADAFDAMRQEYAESGSLSEGTYKALESRGIPKDMVDAYIEGQKALVDRQVQEVYSSVGGQESYTDLVSWASRTLDAEEIEAFNAEVQSGDLRRARLAVKGLAARRQVEERPIRRIEGKSATSSGEAFESMSQVVAAMKDPRYSKDPAYRRQIEARLARSGNLS